MHIDPQRCIWYCFAPQCRGYGGGGIQQLEALAGQVDSGRHQCRSDYQEQRATTGDRFPSLSALREDSLNPNNDVPSFTRPSDTLKAKSRQLFPLPKGMQPHVIVRLYAFQQDPTRAMRQQVISNSWTNPVNRAIKRRVLWPHLVNQVNKSSLDEATNLYEVQDLDAERSDRKRESMAAQVRRRKGEYACFDNRQV